MGSVTSTQALPQVTRPDSAVVLVGEWTVPAGEQQHALDAVTEQWAHLDWPDGLLSHTVLAGDEHHTVLHYTKATSEQGLRAFANTKAAWTAGVDAAVSGITRHGVTAFQLYRSAVTAEPNVAPGCVVVVRFDVDGPAPARAWVDRLIQAGERQEPPAGLLAAHFHIALDGTRILNYAEWTDPAAHQATVEQRPITNNDVVQVVDATPGVRLLDFHRFTHWRTTTPDTPAHWL